MFKYEAVINKVGARIPNARKLNVLKFGFGMVRYLNGRFCSCRHLWNQTFENQIMASLGRFLNTTIYLFICKTTQARAAIKKFSFRMVGAMNRTCQTIRILNIFSIRAPTKVSRPVFQQRTIIMAAIQIVEVAAIEIVYLLSSSSSEFQYESSLSSSSSSLGAAAFLNLQQNQ